VPWIGYSVTLMNHCPHPSRSKVCAMLARYLHTQRTPHAVVVVVVAHKSTLSIRCCYSLARARGTRTVNMFSITSETTHFHSVVSHPFVNSIQCVVVSVRARVCVAESGAVKDARPPQYELVAFVTHMGKSLGFGHYIAHSMCCFDVCVYGACFIYV